MPGGIRHGVAAVFGLWLRGGAAQEANDRGQLALTQTLRICAGQLDQAQADADPVDLAKLEAMLIAPIREATRRWPSPGTGARRWGVTGVAVAPVAPLRRATR